MALLSFRRRPQRPRLYLLVAVAAFAALFASVAGILAIAGGS
jgi:hypothetical protein